LIGGMGCTGLGSGVRIVPVGWVLNDGCENSWQHVLSVAFELATLAGMLVELIRV
jgi:hypothetical protein